MATNKVRITFKVQPEFELDETIYNEIYLVGNVDELGNWNPENALTLVKKNNVYTKTKTFFAGEKIEFKFLLNKTFDKVELDENFVEIANREFVCNESQTINLTVKNFKL